MAGLHPEARYTAGNGTEDRPIEAVPARLTSRNFLLDIALIFGLLFMLRGHRIRNKRGMRTLLNARDKPGSLGKLISQDIALNG